MDNKLVLNYHSAGVFSCVGNVLLKAIEYFNDNKTIPDIIDASNQNSVFEGIHLQNIYPRLFSENTAIDIHYNSPITITKDTRFCSQLGDFSKLNFEELEPFVKRYFNPSENVKKCIDELESKYNIDYENTIGLRYRGTDKSVETIQPSYEEFIEKSVEFNSDNKCTSYLVLSDEHTFISKCKETLPNVIYIEEEKYSIEYYVACVIIFSKCNKLVLTTGNAEWFMNLTRGSAVNTIQYLNHREYIYGIKNNGYNPSKTDYWCKSI